MNWLLAAQADKQHLISDVHGGWASTRSPAAIPNTLDTAGALLCLAEWRRRWPLRRTAAVTAATLDGVRWLLDRQNANGGWAFACRGTGPTAPETSSSDTTSLAVLALASWRKHLRRSSPTHPVLLKIDRALQMGVQYLKSTQQPDGSWIPRWSGNQQHPDGANPVMGTAQVLEVLSVLELGTTPIAQHAVHWLTDVQFPSGGRGTVSPPGPTRGSSPPMPKGAPTARSKKRPWRSNRSCPTARRIRLPRKALPRGLAG